MGKFSELIGSFVRAGAFPLEANYIFSSEQELKEFYNDEVNLATLHKGLLKVVSQGKEQDLYWVAEQEGELYFRKLISLNSLQTIQDLKVQISEIREDLTVDEDLLETIVSKLEDFEIVITTILGSDSANTNDINQFLSKLPYSNIAEIANALHTLEEETADNFKILAAEIRAEIASHKEQHNADISTVTHSINNIQQELNNTQTSLGFDQSGNYNPALGTNYINEAVSVMDALEKIDRALYNKADSNITIEEVKAEIDKSIDALVDDAPEALDTLRELAEALQNKDEIVVDLVTKIESYKSEVDSCKSNIKDEVDRATTVETTLNNLISNLTTLVESLKVKLDNTYSKQEVDYLIDWYEG